MKKIVIFNPSIEGGGVERNLEMIINHLSKKFKNRIYFITFDKNLKLNKTVNIIRPKTNFVIEKRIFKYLFCIISLFKFHIENKDFLIFSFQANVYAILVAKLLNQKIIVRANAAPHGWISKYKKYIISFFYKKADKVIVNSYEFKKEVLKTFKVKPIVIYNPINKKRLYFLSNKKKYFSFFDKFKKPLKILNIGRLTNQKNQIDLIKVVQILKNKIPIKLLIIGSGNNLNYLNESISKKKLSNYIKIIPHCNNPYVYFKKANLFVLSSIYEGLPNVLLEATLFKLLTISYKCKTGPKEILQGGKGGILVNVYDYNKIAQEILKYYHCKKKNNYKKMINISFKNLRKYDYEKQLKKYEKIIFSHLK